MDIKYPLSTDTINKEDLFALAEWLRSDPPPRLTMGPLVKEYEGKWSKWLGRKFSVACNSGSSANLLMYDALIRSGRLRNKKVIVPSAAWVTTIAPAIQLGFEPIMCESDFNTWALDRNHLRELLDKHDPATVILVQVLGVPHYMDDLMKLKEKYGFFLLEDSCAAMGSRYKERKVGTFGDMSSMSTYYGHQFSTIEGGFVSTDDPDLYNMLLMLRSHGWVAHINDATRTDLLKKYEIKDIGTNFVFCEPGYNFRLTDLQAFIGLRQLDRMDWLVEKRFENHCLYKKILSGKFGTQIYDEKSVICSIHFCAIASSYEERNAIIMALNSNGIETRPFTSGNQGLQPYWFKEYGKFSAPVANKLHDCGFFLPNHPGLSEIDIRYICSIASGAAMKYRRGLNNV